MAPDPWENNRSRKISPHFPAPGHLCSRLKSRGSFFELLKLFFEIGHNLTCERIPIPWRKGTYISLKRLKELCLKRLGKAALPFITLTPSLFCSPILWECLLLQFQKTEGEEPLFLWVCILEALISYIHRKIKCVFLLLICLSIQGPNSWALDGGTWLFLLPTAADACEHYRPPTLLKTTAWLLAVWAVQSFQTSTCPTAPNFRGFLP